jgi:hypothetical protein
MKTYRSFKTNRAATITDDRMVIYGRIDESNGEFMVSHAKSSQNFRHELPALNAISRWVGHDVTITEEQELSFYSNLFGHADGY